MINKLIAIFILISAFNSLHAEENVPEWARAPYAYALDHEVNIDSSKLGKCMALAALAESQIPNINRHQMVYPVEQNTDYALFHEHPYHEERFMNYLKAYPSARDRHYSTGQESILRAWILSRSNNSITPYSLFKRSIQLSRGNIWNALLSIHQLLRNEARWWAIRFYNYESSYENQTIFFNKFVDIRGDLRERGQGYFGEHAGGWYRIWGIMLYRYSKIDILDWNLSMNRSFLIRTGRLESEDVADSLSSFADIQANSVAVLAEAYKLLGEDEDDWNKAYINLAGARSANSMIEALTTNQISVNHRKCNNQRFYIKE